MLVSSDSLGKASLGDPTLAGRIKNALSLRSSRAAPPVAMLRLASARFATATRGARALPAPALRNLSSTVAIPDNPEQSTGMERKEEQLSPDVFWDRLPIVGHRGTKENPACVPSFCDSRVVGLETEQGVIWFRLHKGPLHYVQGQYFKLQQLDGGDHH